MPILKLIISPAAQTDLKNIYQYGVMQWGKTQSESYLENLKEKLWSLTKQPLIGIDRSEIIPDTRSLPTESHVLFYRVKPDTIEIIRILHSRQDPQLNLK